MEYPQPDLAQPLRQCPLFARWPADRVRQLAASSRREHYPRRTALATRQQLLNEVYVVEAGAVEISAVDAAGDEHLLAVMRPHQVTGFIQLYEEPGEFKPRFYGHTARAGSTVIHLRGETLARILDEEPLLWKSVALFALRRFHLNLVTIQSQAIGSMRRRLAVQLALLAQQYGVVEPSERGTELHASQTDLALMLGTSRQTVNKELTRLKAEGLVSSEGYGRLTLLDWPRLLRITEEP